MSVRVCFIRNVLILLLNFFFSAGGKALPIVEKHDRVEINWSTLKINYFGEAKQTEVENQTFKDAENQAWQNGLDYIVQAVKEIRKKREEYQIEGEETSLKAANSIASSSYSVNTVYFSSGKVRVDLESNLAKAFRVDGVKHNLESGENLQDVETQYSAIVVKVDKSCRPSSYFKVISKDGEILYQAEDVAKDIYERRLMARWYNNPSKEEIKSAAGVNPLVVTGQVDKNGNISSVDANEWYSALKGSESLLSQGKVLIVFD